MAALAVGLGALLTGFVGANNSASEMGAAYGAGIRTKRQALAIIAVFAFLGAWTAGVPVIRTLGGGLVPAEVTASLEAIRRSSRDALAELRTTLGTFREPEGQPRTPTAGRSPMRSPRKRPWGAPP